MSDIMWVDGWPQHLEVVGGSIAHGMGGAHQESVPYSEREVDALLCERVLGWDKEQWTSSEFCFWDGKDLTNERPPDFKHDIRAAMLLAKGLPSAFWIMWSSGRWVALLDANCKPGEGERMAVARFDAKHGEEAAAIRLASLKAVELQMQETEDRPPLGERGVLS